jgi:hypothetical protein
MNGPLFEKYCMLSMFRGTSIRVQFMLYVALFPTVIYLYLAFLYVGG